ncbi:MCE family protein [Nocardioides sp.]|uniref:MCE family protein n=1 Tax=Nocardioides sp. TaxID=35761 RepID=UPI00286D5C46|nr:MCE family protein [Nocardioides sp.]
MKPLATRDPFKVGLVALMLGLALALGVVALSVVSFGTTSYRAVLEHTAGLREGESVQVHGVDVGKVTKVELGDTDVVVTFVVDEEIELGSETRAAVKVATLLGTHYLEVDPRGEGELAGGEIPLARTSVPYNLQDVIENGTTRLEELDPVVLARALTEASRTLSAAGDDVGPALEGVARLSEVVTRRSDQTGALLRAARSVTDQLSTSSTDIVALMEQTTLVLTEVTDRRRAIRRLLSETTELSRALTAIVTQTQGSVQPALRDLNQALRALNSQDRSLKNVLRVMAPAVRYIANATGSGPYADLYLDDPVLPADDTRCQLTGGC